MIMNTNITHQLPFLFYLPYNPPFNRAWDDRLADTSPFHSQPVIPPSPFLSVELARPLPFRFVLPYLKDVDARMASTHDMSQSQNSGEISVYVYYPVLIDHCQKEGQPVLLLRC